MDGKSRRYAMIPAFGMQFHLIILVLRMGMFQPGVAILAWSATAHLADEAPGFYPGDHRRTCARVYHDNDNVMPIKLGRCSSLHIIVTESNR